MAEIPTPVSPKVTAASVTSAVTVLVMYLLHLVPFIAAFPVPVQGALLVIVTGAVTYVAGYVRRDPLRNLLAYGGKHSA